MTTSLITIFSTSLILISQDFSQDTVAENHLSKNPGQLFLSLLEILLNSLKIWVFTIQKKNHQKSARIFKGQNKLRIYSDFQTQCGSGKQNLALLFKNNFKRLLYHHFRGQGVGQDSLPSLKKKNETCHLHYSLTLDVVKEPFDDAIEYTTTLHTHSSDALFFSGGRFTGCKHSEEEKENRSAFAKRERGSPLSSYNL